MEFMSNLYIFLYFQQVSRWGWGIKDLVISDDAIWKSAKSLRYFVYNG